MSLAFSSSGCDVLTRKVDLSDEARTVPREIDDYYSLSQCVVWIQENSFKCVCLQLPDEYLRDAVEIVHRIETRVTAKVYVLGDTTYGSCCVDEIAAQHVGADAVVHFGHSCLSPVVRLPVLYVFPQHLLNCPHAANQFRDTFPDPSAKVLMLYDTEYCQDAVKLAEQLRPDYDNLVLSKLDISLHPQKSSVFPLGAVGPEPPESPDIRKCGRVFGLSSDSALEDYAVFFLGPESLFLTNAMMTFVKCRFFRYDPQMSLCRQETLKTNRLLKRRYFMMERAKDAGTVGILAGTLGVADYLSIIRQTKSAIRRTGKRAYLMSMGRPDVAKLANFPEVDVFVLVSCPENALLDSKEFFRPVVTPFEMEIACNEARQWTGNYVTDFRNLLPGAADYVPCEPRKEADVSLITGSIRFFGLQETSVNSGDDGTGTNCATPAGNTSAEVGGSHIGNRSWKGLEPSTGETAATSVTMGQSGMASQYQGEGET